MRTATSAIRPTAALTSSRSGGSTGSPPHPVGRFSATTFVLVQEMNDAYTAALGDSPPARIALGGVDLALGAGVEMDCVAYRSNLSNRGRMPHQPEGAPRR